MAKDDPQDTTPADVGSPAANAELEHTEGGATTRSDLTDAGVPMVQGKADEPVGPEDAMGPGPKRGDYSGRIDSGPHMVSEPIPVDERGPAHRYVDGATGKEAKEGAEGAVRIPNEQPTARLVDQSARAAASPADQPGKGGVSTKDATASPAGA